MQQLVASRGWDALHLEMRENVVKEQRVKGIVARDETKRFATAQSRSLMH